MRKIQRSLLTLKRSQIYRYKICMTVPLIRNLSWPYQKSLRGSVHTQTARLNVKLTLVFKPHPPVSYHQSWRIKTINNLYGNCYEEMHSNPHHVQESTAKHSFPCQTLSDLNMKMGCHAIVLHRINLIPRSYTTLDRKHSFHRIQGDQ